MIWLQFHFLCPMKLPPVICLVCPVLINAHHLCSNAFLRWCNKRFYVFSCECVRVSNVKLCIYVYCFMLIMAKWEMKMFSSHMSVRATLDSHCHSDLDTSYGVCISHCFGVGKCFMCWYTLAAAATAAAEAAYSSHVYTWACAMLVCVHTFILVCVRVE